MELSRKKKRLVEIRIGPRTENRMRDIINCLSRGLSEKQVSKAMGCSQQTVKHYTKLLRDYFGAGTTLEAILMARREWKLKI